MTLFAKADLPLIPFTIPTIAKHMGKRLFFTRFCRCRSASKSSWIRTRVPSTISTAMTIGVWVLMRITTQTGSTHPFLMVSCIIRKASGSSLYRRDDESPVMPIGCFPSRLSTIGESLFDYPVFGFIHVIHQSAVRLAYAVDYLTVRLWTISGRNTALDPRCNEFNPSKGHCQD